MLDEMKSPRSMSGKALVTVPAILLLGFFMGAVSNSGFGNAWYDPLTKPSFQPPGWAFGATWTLLYLMMGVALAAVLDAPRSSGRGRALTLFFIQLTLNYAWSPIFFGGGMISIHSGPPGRSRTERSVRLCTRPKIGLTR